MSQVFVVDTKKHPLNPVPSGSARLLLKAGKAAVFKRYPFTLILKTAREVPPLKPVRIKLDPGSRTTGIAVVDDASGTVVFAAELTHRGKAIKKRLTVTARRLVSITLGSTAWSSITARRILRILLCSFCPTN